MCKNFDRLTKFWHRPSSDLCEFFFMGSPLPPPTTAHPSSSAVHLWLHSWQCSLPPSHQHELLKPIANMKEMSTCERVGTQKDYNNTTFYEKMMHRRTTISGSDLLDARFSNWDLEKRWQMVQLCGDSGLRCLGESYVGSRGPPFYLLNNINLHVFIRKILHVWEICPNFEPGHLFMKLFIRIESSHPRVFIQGWWW